MIGASMLLFVLALDRGVSTTDGLLLLVLMVAYTVFLIWQSRRANAAFQAEAGAEIAAMTRGSWDDKLPLQILLVIGGLGLLLLGADWFVKGAVHIAVSFGVSELVIGLTVVALGTSLPEIVTSLLAAVRGERDMAVGNVIGSNIFNILGCLGLTAIVAPNGIPVTAAMLSFDLPVMIVVAVACLPIFFSGNLISRWEGVVFVAYYFAYTAYLILAAQQHAAIETFEFVILWVALPLTLLTLVVIVYRQLQIRTT